MSITRRKPSRNLRPRPKKLQPRKNKLKKVANPHHQRRKFVRAIAFILVGAVLVFAPTFVKNHAPQTNSLSSNFAQEPVRTDFANSETKEEDLPERIIIPQVNIDLPVKLAPVQNGYWVVYSDSAGFGEGSAPPGKDGNTVVFAHARKGMFLNLKDIGAGDKVYILTKDKHYSYEVKEIKTVFPNQIEVISPTPDQTLTLYTCSGFLDKKRLIVIAKPI